MGRGQVEAALARARNDVEEGRSAPASGARRTLQVAIGDPQAPLETFFEVLDSHGLLGEDGRLRPEVQLVSMGDHFDWGPPHERERATRDGLGLLSWLAAHPADQAVLLLGNHDLARVGELARFDDAAFEVARAEADAAYRQGAVDPALERAFLARYPDLPSAEVLARDFSTFCQAQRRLVTTLLRARRFRIAHSPAADLLLCHAGVTRDDLEAIGVPAERQHRADEVAAALNAVLDEAVARWAQGPLELEPLHRAGDARRGEGRGIFYHRPSHPDHEAPELFAGPPRRRFDPRRLPPGLTQGIGHIRDKKCRELLRGWASPEPALDGPLRVLRTDGEQVRYARLSAVPGLRGVKAASEAVLLFLDGGMSHCPPTTYELLDLGSRRPLSRPGEGLP